MESLADDISKYRKLIDSMFSKKFEVCHRTDTNISLKGMTFINVKYNVNIVDYLSLDPRHEVSIDESMDFSMGYALITILNQFINNITQALSSGNSFDVGKGISIFKYGQGYLIFKVNKENLIELIKDSNIDNFNLTNF